MKILDWENTAESAEALRFYKKMRINKESLNSDSWNCNAHDTFKVILHFEADGEECGLLVEKKEKEGGVK